MNLLKIRFDWCVSSFMNFCFIFHSFFSPISSNPIIQPKKNLNENEKKKKE